LDGILLIYHAQETCKSTTHHPGPYPTSLTMISIPSPDGPIFIAMAFFQQMKTKDDVANNIVSRYNIVHSALLTKFVVTGHYQMCTGVVKKNFSTQQSTWMKMAVAWQHWEVALGTG
jgi:hypothetical protein